MFATTWGFIEQLGALHLDEGPVFLDVVESCHRGSDSEADDVLAFEGGRDAVQFSARIYLLEKGFSQLIFSLRLKKVGLRGRTSQRK